MLDNVCIAVMNIIENIYGTFYMIECQTYTYMYMIHDTCTYYTCIYNT